MLRAIVPKLFGLRTAEHDEREKQPFFTNHLSTSYPFVSLIQSLQPEYCDHSKPQISNFLYVWVIVWYMQWRVECVYVHLPLLLRKDPMNRREFLGYCVPAGMTIDLRSLVSWSQSSFALSPEDKA